MERSPNSIEEVQLGAIARISDRNTGGRQQHQQLLRWKMLMQRLEKALESGNLGQARQAFEAMLDDAPEPGLPDPMAHSQFIVLGKALQSLNLVEARDAYPRLLQEAPFLRHHHSSHPATTENSNSSEETTHAAHGALDVTA